MTASPVLRLWFWAELLSPRLVWLRWVRAQERGKPCCIKTGDKALLFLCTSVFAHALSEALSVVRLSHMLTPPMPECATYKLFGSAWLMSEHGSRHFLFSTSLDQLCQSVFRRISKHASNECHTALYLSILSSRQCQLLENRSEDSSSIRTAYYCGFYSGMVVPVFGTTWGLHIERAECGKRPRVRATTTQARNPHSSIIQNLFPTRLKKLEVFPHSHGVL